MGFSGVNNFPTHCIIDGRFRDILEETGMGVEKEVEMIGIARRMDLFTIVYVSTREEARAMADVGADAIIAHVGTTVGGSIGVTGATVSLNEAAEWTQRIIDGAKASGRRDIIYLSHGGPILTTEDAQFINDRTEAMGFVGACSLERMAVEESLTELTAKFKQITPGIPRPQGALTEPILK
jgi:predicted TIM-barrel enzyme